jgi:prepilin-type N-terminal cleavage/methylation domain-containing protein/prepilin-type processing-associated H-X9-DG protein
MGARDGLSGHAPDTQGRRGFSLVELLIVIGIILLLIGLLLPTVSRARVQSRALKCREQLRQIGVALCDYAQVNNGVLGPGPCWDAPWDIEWPEILFGQRHPPVVVCPTAVDDEVLSYQINQYLWMGLVNRLGKPLAMPVEEIIVAGENLPGSNDTYSPQNGIPEGQTVYDPERHGPRLGSNFLFMDFHVSNELPPLRKGHADHWYIPPPPSFDPATGIFP